MRARTTPAAAAEEGEEVDEGEAAGSNKARAPLLLLLPLLLTMPWTSIRLVILCVEPVGEGGREGREERW